MKIDRHVSALLRKRTCLAKELDSVCRELDRYLLENEIEPDGACWLGGVEIYVNPEAAEEEVRNKISEKGKGSNAAIFGSQSDSSEP